MLATDQKRGDIQGLRAWAVILVVLGHLLPEFLPGGFIGVDIFFVISGFVITRQMVRLREIAPKTFLRDFYARRIRRILPGALFVILVSFLLTRRYLGIVAENDFKSGAGWVSIFLGNFHFQRESLDYFAAGLQAHPLQHFWSLSIEEQFYLLWPALFLALSAFVFSAQLRICVLALIALTSLTSALYLSEIAKDPIFFNSFTRVWELAAGALLALIGLRVRISRLGESITLAMLLLLALSIAPGMQWPRLTSLPVIAIAIYLLSQSEERSSILLNNPIMRYIGDLSYLIYLWHWPFLILLKNTRQSYDFTSITLVIALTLIATLATHYWLEKPIRKSDLLIRYPIFTIIGALSAVSLSAAYFFLTYTR